MRLEIIDASSKHTWLHLSWNTGVQSLNQNDKHFVRSGKVETPESFLAEWNWGKQENQATFNEGKEWNWGKQENQAIFNEGNNN
jgi:hypothetical protein